MRKGQAQHIMAYLMVIVVVLAILYLGVMVFGNIMKGGCSLQESSFTERLKEDISSGAVFGAYAIKEYAAPCAMNRICFVDRRDMGNAQFSAKIEAIQSSVRSGVQNNIFLLSKDKIKPLGFSGKLVVSDDLRGSPLCINATAGSFNWGLRGRGRDAQVEQEV